MNTAPNNTGSSSSGGCGGFGGFGGFGVGAGGSGGGPCGACKFLRRKCQFDCLFAPYFNSDQGAAHFAAVHKVFGASNFSKLLQNLPPHMRHDAVVTICYEAQARLHDPIYGCVGHIFALQQQVVNLQTEISYMQARLATLELPVPAPPFSQPPMIQLSSPVVPVPDLPSALGMPSASSFDLSMFFDPEVRMEFREYGGGGGRNPSDNSNLSITTTGESSGGGDDDFQALARELLLGQGTSLGSAPSTEPSPELQPPPPP